MIYLPAADHTFGGNSAGQLKDYSRAGMQDENDSDDEDMDNPPVVTTTSEKSFFSEELASLDGNLISTWKAPTLNFQRRRQTNLLC